VGVIVDGGSFLGRSAWFLATGLAANPNLGREKKLPIHCFDNFIVNDDLTTEAIQDQFGVRLPLGASTRRLFDAAVVNVAEWLEVHEGDFRTYVWKPRPIEILFVDVAKSTVLNRRLVESMFPCLLPGVSVVVQQDYHHPWLPHIHITMEHLSDYFEIVEPKIDDSAAFLCTRPISAEVAAEAATLNDRLPPAALLALMDRAIARLPAEHRCHVELARANLVGRTYGRKNMQAELARIDDRYGARTSDEVWSRYRRQMQDFLKSMPWDLSEAWRLVSSGLVAEGLAAAEEVGPNVANYVDALILRAHCLRLLRRTREAAEALVRAVQEREGEPDAWVEIAWLRLEQGDVPGAVEAGRRAHQCCVGRGDSVEGNAFDVLGLALSAAGRRQEALASSAQAVACNPKNAWILVHHADNLVHVGELTEAAGVVEAALAIDPEHSGAANIRATLEARQPRKRDRTSSRVGPTGAELNELRRRLKDGWRRVAPEPLSASARARITAYLRALEAVNASVPVLSPEGESMVADDRSEETQIPDLPALQAALQAIELFQICYGPEADCDRFGRRLSILRGFLTPDKKHLVESRLRQSSIHEVHAFIRTAPEDQFVSVIRSVSLA
jgi:tetratricopeptide (TPR) repeat protein